MDQDEEEGSTPTEGRGRKRINELEWTKVKKRMARNNKKTKPQSPIKCKHNDGTFVAMTISGADILDILTGLNYKKESLFCLNIT